MPLEIDTKQKREKPFLLPEIHDIMDDATSATGDHRRAPTAPGWARRRSMVVRVVRR
jgi:hypothetical protein